MDEEQCNFDELSAMLNVSDEELSMSTPATAACTQGDEESSDDDIDDDELDRLAMLVEKGEDTQNPSLAKDVSPGPAENAEKESHVLVKDSDRNAEPSQGEQSQEALLDELRRTKERLQQLEELQRMKDRVQQLEAQVNTNTKESIAPKKSTTKTPDTKRNASKADAKSPASSQQNQKTNGANILSNSAKKVSAPRILKDLEVDLFGTDSDSSKKATPSSLPKSPAPQNRKPSSSTTKAPRSGANLINGDRNTLANQIENEEYDWDMESEGGSYLSKEGKEMESLLTTRTNRGQRTAHTANYDMSSISNRKATWGSKAPSSNGATAASNFKQMKKEEDANVSRDPFSGIRILNPLVSSLQMKTRMENRNIVKLSTIYQKPKSSLEGDWVTIGVMVHKTDPKTSQKGNAFSIWTLSDLHDCNHTVKMFLFGETHKTHWKTSVGCVVGILNPSIMQNNEKYQKKDDEVCITLDHPQKLMLMGKSKDFGFCKSTTKAGRACIQFINKQQGEHCSYHVQSAYKKVSAKRSELQAGHTGVTPRSFEKKILGTNRNNQVFYGGQSFNTVPTKKDNKASMKSLVQHGARSSQGKVTTLALHPILPEDAEKMRKAELALEAEKNKAFHEMLTTPTVGSINLVKHLAKKECTIPDAAPTSKAIQYVTAKDLLVQHKQNIDQRRLNHIKKRELTQSSGPMINLDEPTTAPASKPSNPFQCVPKLGRGFSLGSQLDKKKAAFLINSKGGIKKDDPNAIRKHSTAESRENIKKRLLDSSEKPETSSSADEPPKKKSRLLGDLDLDDPEVRKLLKSKSKHAHRLTEMEEEKQEAYFSVLEKKEAMEQKMASIFKVEVTAVRCKQCKYSAFSALPSCKEERHNISTFKTFKRFFSCKECKRRTVSLDRLPSVACAGCGSRNFEKAAMMKEKTAALLPSEQLLLRGEERKYVNS